MSIPVSLDRLSETMTEFGAGYLLTVSGEARVKVVTVEPTLTAGVLVMAAPGPGTLANVAGNPQVTVAFPPPEPRGFTLLVDGTAEVTGDDVRVTPSAAVLHRPAAHRDGPPPPAVPGDAQSR
jgi:hypothetical protein